MIPEILDEVVVVGYGDAEKETGDWCNGAGEG